MSKRPHIVKAMLLGVILSIFVFTNTSCAQTTAPEKPAVVKPAEPPTETVQAPDDQPPAQSDDLVYLKVQSAAVSGFDETPDWAPRPDAMAPFDADMETRWSSAYKEGEWIYMDFGNPKTISKIVIKWEQAYAPSFEILSSDDANTWQRVVMLEGQKGGTNEIVFQPVRARYVKIAGLSRASEDWGISIWEVEPYGPKDKNPNELPYDQVFSGRGEKSEFEKRRTELNIQPGAVIPSPGPIVNTEFQRGVNYTSWNTDELLSDISDYSLIYLSQLGVGHIALMAVYYQDDAESQGIYYDEEKTVSDESLGHAINMIHALGMKVMLKPHVDLVDDDARSNIIPSDEWFKGYKEFILHYAALAAKYNVELFCIGTELSNTTTERWKANWLDIIKSVKQVYSGPLIYAANWDEYETVSFWDEMDYIGMDAYFPLTNKNDPPKEELIAAWNRQADILEKWLETSGHDKPIVFTEIGYDTVLGSNKQPWRILPTLASQVESQDEQANCLESLLMVLTNRPWFKGFYWWNYFPRPDLGPLGYTLRGKKGEKILSEWFRRLK